MDTPRESLEVTQTNRPPPAGEDWATDLVNGSSSIGSSAADIAIKLSKANAFPVCDREWTQVGASDEDYDLDPVGFSGWLLQPETSTADLPFTHPFGFDWECMVALDPQFSSLLARGNTIPDGDGKKAVKQAGDLGVPIPEGGLLAVETDGGNVPSAFKEPEANVLVGDRIAVFGRWIVDTGHAVDMTPRSLVSDGAPTGPVVRDHRSVAASTPPAVAVVRDHRGSGGAAEGGVSVSAAADPADGAVRDHRGSGGAAEGGVSVSESPGHRGDLGSTSFRSEVHPPLLMAAGGTRNAADGTAITRILVTSRPYLVSQQFTTDTGTIYDDTSGNDGTFLHHMDNEIDKITSFIPESKTLEAHLKVKSKPFGGTHFFQFTVRPPTESAASQVLEANFQLTHRTGVGVEVTMEADEVVVRIAMNSNQYVAPPLPDRHPDWWTKPRLNRLESSSGDLLTFEEIVTGFKGLFVPLGQPTTLLTEDFISKGILTDKYDASDVDILDRSHAVGWTRPESLPPGKGIVTDDSQPYPVFGFIAVRHVAGIRALDVDATQVHIMPIAGGNP